MKLVIVDYGSGNLRSAAKAFERAARESGVAATIDVSGRPEDVAAADRIVLPGVGAFADCRNGLHAIDGMGEALNDAVERRARPLFGICVGTQLMANLGHEHGKTPGFGWIGGDVVAIEPEDPALKIPHMGWNTLDLCRDHPVVDGIAIGNDGLHAYFVHSFHLVPKDEAALVATADYAGPVTAIVARDTVFGTQFHPEKSQALGLGMIANFLRWSP